MASELKVCIIGGSNSLMKDGYTATMLHRLKVITGQPLDVINLSVGGTFIHFGLWQALRTGKHKNADVIILEYALNDAELMFKGMFEHWERAFEGVLRLLNKDAPNAKIIAPILYREEGVHTRKMSILAAGVSYYAGRYNLRTVDMQDEIAQRFPSDFLKRNRIYKDKSHYTPLMQALIGNIVADVIVEELSTTRLVVDFPKINTHSYDNAKCLKGTLENYISGPFERVKFANSKFKEEALKLKEGSKLKFLLKGQLLALLAVSVKQDGILHIKQHEDDSYFSVYRRAIKKGKHDFLLNCILPDQYFPKIVEHYEDFKEIEIDLVKKDDENKLNSDRIKTRGTTLLPPEEPENREFNLIDILYIGEIKPIS